MYKIIHLVSSFEKLNYGVWHAATTSSKTLEEQYGIENEVWSFKRQTATSLLPDIKFLHLPWAAKFKQGFLTFLYKHAPCKQTTIIVSHGCWGYPTALAHYASKCGYKWIATPQGMLEPWSMQQKKLKKSLYYLLFEKRWLMKANAIRAVSSNEEMNLKHVFKHVYRVPNGISIPENKNERCSTLTFLFLARLHHKKGILPLVKAWQASKDKLGEAKLIIAGPDEGELEKITPFLNKRTIYLGPVYGADKAKLLRSAHFYVLPSYSEGFPSSVIEAMSYGLIPIISDGCNFIDVFDQDLGYKISTNPAGIAEVLQQVAVDGFNRNKANRNINFVANNYAETILATSLFQLYKIVIEQ